MRFVRGFWMFLLLLFPWIIDTAKFKFTNLVCESLNNSILEVNTCRLKAISRTKTVINFDSTLKETTNELWVHGEMFKRANGYKPWLFNVTVEGCRFYRRAYDPVAKMFYNFFKPFSNLNHSCPYAPGPIRVWGFHVLPEPIPLPVPSGDYLVMVMWSIHNRPTLWSNVSFSFQED